MISFILKQLLCPVSDDSQTPQKRELVNSTLDSLFLIKL